jgi:hypothetical protein
MPVVPASNVPSPQRARCDHGHDRADGEAGKRYPELDRRSDRATDQPQGQRAGQDDGELAGKRAGQKCRIANQIVRSLRHRIDQGFCAGQAIDPGWQLVVAGPALGPQDGRRDRHFDQNEHTHEPQDRAVGIVMQPQEGEAGEGGDHVGAVVRHHADQQGRHGDTAGNLAPGQHLHHQDRAADTPRGDRLVGIELGHAQPEQGAKGPGLAGLGQHLMPRQRREDIGRALCCQRHSGRAVRASSMNFSALP